MCIMTATSTVPSEGPDPGDSLLYGGGEAVVLKGKSAVN